jgi:phosphate transport system protein
MPIQASDCIVPCAVGGYTEPILLETRTHVSSFAKKLEQLKGDLVTQGNRVVDLVLRATEAAFHLDGTSAQGVIDDDSVIDKVDVEIERASIPLLALGPTDEHDIRSVLTIVKINNELERIADCAVSIAETVMESRDEPEKLPDTLHVMANSVIGMLREANTALVKLDTALAERVLRYDDTVVRFKREILFQSQTRLAEGLISVPLAFRVLTIAQSFERIADHCTNICEQVIYLESGLIVRHAAEGWTRPTTPD